MRKRVSIVVEVDLDPLPGQCDSLESWIKILEFMLPAHYNPTVRPFRGRVVASKPYSDMSMAELGEVVIG
jgi:hypothetical protein